MFFSALGLPATPTITTVILKGRSVIATKSHPALLCYFLGPFSYLDFFFSRCLLCPPVKCWTQSASCVQKSLTIFCTHSWTPCCCPFMAVLSFPLLTLLTISDCDVFSPSLQSLVPLNLSLCQSHTICGPCCLLKQEVGPTPRTPQPHYISGCRTLRRHTELQWGGKPLRLLRHVPALVCKAVAKHQSCSTAPHWYYHPYPHVMVHPAMPAYTNKVSSWQRKTGACLQ